MKRKWPLLFLGAVCLAALALARLLPANSINFAFGVSVGLAFGAAVSWIAERGA